MSKRITALILALAVVFGSVISLSSCSPAFSDWLENYTKGDESQDNDTPPQNNEENEEPKNDPTDSTPPSDDSTSTEDEEENKEESTPPLVFDGEYYPGQGSVAIEDIAPKNRTLLSTVVVTSKFGTTPSAGAGVFYKLDKNSGDAYIITNYHVVFSKNYGICSSASIYLYGMTYSDYAIPATVIGGSVNFDIAVLKVSGSELIKNSYATEAVLGNSDHVRVFDEVFAVGNPEGYGFAVTEGIVSVDSESLDMTGCDGSAITLRVMRVSAAINEGNSGGGLYDENGKLVGIVCAKRIGADIDNMAYAIPVNLAKNLADNIIDNCDGTSVTKVQRALIGIEITAKVVGLVADPETGELYKAECVKIGNVQSTSLARNMLAVGDIINSITVDGVKVNVTRMHHVTDHMLNARKGSTVSLNITRGENNLNVEFIVPPSAITSEK